MKNNERTGSISWETKSSKIDILRALSDSMKYY